MTEPTQDPFVAVRQLMVDTTDLALLSALAVAGTIMFLPGIQKRWSYALAAFVFGILFSLAARRLGLPDGADIIAVMLGVLTGPVTAAKLQGKTLAEAIDEIQKSRRNGGLGGDDLGDGDGA